MDEEISAVWDSLAYDAGLHVIMNLVMGSPLRT